MHGILFFLLAYTTALAEVPETEGEFGECLYRCTLSNPYSPAHCVGLCSGTNAFQEFPGVGQFGGTPQTLAPRGASPSYVPQPSLSGLPNWDLACAGDPGNPLCGSYFSPEPAPTCTLKITQKWDKSPTGTGWWAPDFVGPIQSGFGSLYFELKVNGNADSAKINGESVSAQGGRFDLGIPAARSVATVSGPGGESQCQLEGVGMRLSDKGLGEAAKNKCSQAYANSYCQKLGWGNAKSFQTMAAQYGIMSCIGGPGAIDSRTGRPCFIPSGPPTPADQVGNCTYIECLPPDD